MECKKAQTQKRCPCTYDPCPRKGVCCDCLSYHLANRELPGCCFPTDAEGTFDRSFGHFAKLVVSGKV